MLKPPLRSGASPAHGNILWTADCAKGNWSKDAQNLENGQERSRAGSSIPKSQNQQSQMNRWPDDPMAQSFQTDNFISRLILG